MSVECNAGKIPHGYKQTEVGIIPGDWGVEPLRCDVTLLSGQHVLAQHCNTSGHGVPYLTGPADFPNNKIEQTKFTDRPTTLCKAGDILATVKGSGSGTLIVADASYCISRQLMAIRVKEWDAKFLFYSLLQNISKIKNSSAGLIPGLSRSDILDQEIPLPKIFSEQKAIAEALSDADALIESLEQLIAKKRQIKQQAMQELITGKRRLPEFGEGKGYKHTEVGMIPEDWKIVTLSNVCTLHNGRAYALHEWETTGVPVIRLQNLTGGNEYYYSSLQLPEQKYCNRGDLLYMWSATFGPYIWMGDRAIYHYHIWKVVPQEEKSIRQYLYYKFMEITEEKKMRASNGGTMLHITKGSMELTPIALPPLPEQEAIAKVLSDMDSEITAFEEKLAKARHIKQGMMQELLTGRIRLI